MNPPSPDPFPIMCRLAQNADELTAAFAVRVEVFVEEQGCALENERDEHDAVARHFIAITDSEVIGTARAYDCGDGRVKVGRVAVRRAWRGKGVGERLMNAAHDWARSEGYRDCVLHAQTAVIGFYERLGYRAQGEVFHEENIPHRVMRRLIP